VEKIMKPRVDVVAIDIDSTNEEVIRIANECGFSRLPVYQEDLDDIRGFLYIKDMLPYIVDRSKEFNWKDHIREAYFVPESKKINDLLEEFRNKKMHLAVVVDEYGGTDGIVTLEDILEEIVGEIVDESDFEELNELNRR
jgi:CBS domain containing-hemolysin-like protein